ncbi:MAG: hypothetical protein CME48_00195 [Halieaceae bacterium]|nr:hypothetical protein [Halieaceae bacterium]
MDPKVFFETGQTTGKNVSGNATDTSGETAKQAGKAFKEAFNAANAAGNVDPEATRSPRTADSKVITSAESPDSKATVTSEKLHYTANPSTENVDSSVRELMAKAPLDHDLLASAQPVGYGKPLPHSQETGNFYPPDNKLGPDLTRDSEALVNSTKPEANSQRWVAETMELVSREATDAIRVASASQLSSSESSSVKPQIDKPDSYSPNAELISQPADSRTDNGSISRVRGPQGLIEIALPNGPASFSEVVEFAKSQSLPSSFTNQVFSGYRGSASPASNDPLLAEQMTTATLAEQTTTAKLAEQMTTATRVAEVDVGIEVDAGAGVIESGLSANTAFLSEEATFDQIEKLANSAIFIDQLASVLAPKSEGSSSMQQAVEIDQGEVAALIKRTLSSSDGFTAKSYVATYELSNDAIQIRGAVIDAIGSDKAIKLSDFDVNKLANLLEQKFFSAVSPRLEVAVQTQTPVEVTSAAQMIGAGSFWALNDNGDLTTSKVQRDAEYRLGVSAAATGTPDRPRQIELDSSMIAAQKPVGPNPRVPSSAQGKFEILDVEAQTREKTFTSSDALNLRSFANNRGVEDAPTVRPLSSNPLVAPVSPESQSPASAAPLTNSVGDPSGLNYVSASGTGYPLVSRSTNNDGSRAMQYQSSVNTVRDVVALSERFSQVLTERLVQNVKSGNYNLRFNVHPRELGAVDIAMEVRDGRLDAQISSTNPVTRDLLSESLPRLRDALQAGGLQLSNLEVNDNAHDNQKRGLMSPDDQDDSAIESNETVSTLLVEDLTLDTESVDYLA